MSQPTLHTHPQPVAQRCCITAWPPHQWRSDRGVFVLCVAQVTPTLALYDTMQYVRSPTATVCYGMCLGMGGFLLTAGGEKVRIARPFYWGGGRRECRAQGGCQQL
jgi:hypothetical protein